MTLILGSRRSLWVLRPLLKLGKGATGTQLTCSKIPGRALIKQEKIYKPTDLTVNGDFSTMIRSYSSRSYITCSLDLIFCWHSCQCHCTTTEVLDNMSLSLRDLHPGHRAVLEAGLDCKGWWFVDIPPSLKWMTLLLERMNLQVCCTPSLQIYLNLKMEIWQIDMFFSIKFMLKCHSCLQEPMLLGDRLGQKYKEILSIQGREDLTENAV